MRRVSACIGGRGSGRCAGSDKDGGSNRGVRITGLTLASHAAMQRLFPSVRDRGDRGRSALIDPVQPLDLLHTRHS